MSGIAGCCARATTGHAAAAPPSSVMNSRRLSLDHLVSAGEQRRRNSRPSAFAVIRLMTKSNRAGYNERQIGHPFAL